MRDEHSELDKNIEEGNRAGPPVEPFQCFVNEHYQAAYRFALSLCGDYHDACDITQQSFYLAHLRSSQLRDSNKRKQWLFSILYREFLHIRRRKTSHSEVSLEFSEPELPHSHVDHAINLDGRAVLVVLQSLEENFRAPVALFYLSQLSYKEIAVALDVPIGTVMSRLARGKEMLRQKLEQNHSVAVNNVGPLPPKARERVND